MENFGAHLGEFLTMLGQPILENLCSRVDENADSENLKLSLLDGLSNPPRTNF